MPESAFLSPSPLAVWSARILGGLLAAIGLVLTIGGGWLLALGGSAYYLLAGLGLIVSGALVFLGRRWGGWLYVGICGLTLIWALWESGLDGWALVPRLVAPAVLLVPLIILFPALGPTPPPRRAQPILAGGFAAVVIVLLLALGLAGRPPRAATLPATDMAMSDPSLLPVGADWPAYGGTYAARRFTPLTQIKPDNVGRLKRVWTAHTGDLPSRRAEGKYGSENTPLKVGDHLYLCSAKDIVIDLDPATGKARWRYDPKVPDDAIPYTAACRGVAYYANPQVPTPDAAAGQACAARIIVGTLDARLIALDALTGRPCQDFGQGGQINTAAGMGDYAPGMASITSAPTIVRGVVVVGHQILDGQRRWAPSGVIQGFDAVTGKLRWAWDMARPERTGYPPPGETFTKGTPNMWTTASGDEALGLVYVPLGNSAADYWSGLRTPPENAHSSSLVAIDVATGKPAWTFQTVHNDVWDYDLGAQATLIDYPTPAGSVPALVLPSKQGDIYILDRRTGRPLTPVEERPAPTGGVEPQKRSQTQPHSLFQTVRKDDLTERQMWGMSPIDQMICRIQFRRASYKGFYTPPTTERRWIEYPSYNGGVDWGGVAVDPRRGIIVANYNDMPNYNRLVPRAVADAKGWKPRGAPGTDPLKGGPEGAGDPQVGTPYAIQVNAGWRMPFTGLLCKQPPYGGIRAIDIRTGRTLWDRPLGLALNNGPFGIPSMLPISIGTPNNGGAVVTASGLIFIAAATDDQIRAIDLRTGKVVWRDSLPGGGQATPMIYEQDGREYLVIVPGGHHFMETKVSDAVVAYALS